MLRETRGLTKGPRAGISESLTISQTAASRQSCERVGDKIDQFYDGQYQGLELGLGLPPSPGVDVYLDLLREQQEGGRHLQHR